jgi:hypothetical protein
MRTQQDVGVLSWIQTIQTDSDIKIYQKQWGFNHLNQTCANDGAVDEKEIVQSLFKSKSLVVLDVHIPNISKHVKSRHKHSGGNS